MLQIDMSQVRPGQVMEDVKRLLVLAALKKNWTKKEAAKELGLPIRTMQVWLRDWRIQGLITQEDCI